MKKTQDYIGESITITEIKMNEMRFNIIGTSPLMPHAVSAKAAGSLLFPAPKKNAAEKATSKQRDYKGSSIVCEMLPLRLISATNSMR